MADPLCSLPGGDLRDAPLAAVLVEALRARATGELKIDAKGGTSRVYLKSGQPCGAQIFFDFKPLGQFLMELGWIDIEALERSLAAVASGDRQGEALVSLGYLTAERLDLGLSLHHQRHLRTLAGLTEGHYAFLPSERLPEWTASIRISAHRAILDALSVAPGQQVSRRILGRLPDGKGLRLRDGWQNFTGHFQLDPYEERLVQRLVRPMLPADLARVGSVPAEKAAAVASALYLMGVAIPATPEALVPEATLEPVDEEPPPAPAPQEPVHTPARAAASAEDRKRRLFEAQQREIEDQERQRRAVEEESRRIREQEEEAARRAREEARSRPPPEFRSDAASARERRTRLLQKAIGRIPGAEIFRRAASGDAPPPAAPAQPAAPPHAAPASRAPVNGASPGPQVEVVKPQERPSEVRAPSAGEDAARFRKHVEEKHAVVAREDHFARLGLPWTASRDQIKQAFFTAAKLYHPDKLAPELAELGPKLKDIFGAVNDAYQVLQDDERRRGYLAELRKGNSRSAAETVQDDGSKMHVAQAEMALRKRDYARAEAAFRKAAKSSGRADLLAQAAWALYSDLSRGQGEAAKAELQQIVHDSPSCAPAHYFLGVIAKLSGNNDEAERRFREAVKANPKHLEANQELRLMDMRRKPR